MRGYISSLIVVLTTLFLASCGGGEEAPVDADQLPIVTDTKAIMNIQARGSWQCMGFNMTGGDKILIKSTGQWSGGQRDRASAGSNILSKVLYTDADGGNGLAYDNNGNVVSGISFAVQVNAGLCGTEPCGVQGIRSGAYCDASLEQTIPGILPAQRCNGATPLPALMITIPGTVDLPSTPSQSLNVNNNRGPTCSDKNRIVSVLYGFPHALVKAHECLPINKNRLIGKIVPKGSDPLTIAPIDVAKKYETLPYAIAATAPSETDICFRNNDTDIGLDDNDGYLQVTVEKVP